MRFLAIIVGLFLPTFAAAQVSDSTFRDYAEFSAFVDTHSQSRDITKLLTVLGGRDEYTKEQMANLQAQVFNLYPDVLPNKTIFHENDLGGGVRQEVRAYWTGLSYLYLYFLLHERDDALIVLRFAFNSSAEKIMENL
ncbi:hypothetical protein SAMN05444000_11956 [Shimia gijangensis]|uniref:DUF3887 domain-containing protein n=1 Tax=Shimia gijangensis TaxID=1470563 RepID=A0A1M6PUQ7_9RHOB|nr:hypothetical protein [Shimia gijangensis]SHK11685.1 hypothetical protein SAMN05444000_11956 [Shimia gijangensis]